MGLIEKIVSVLFLLRSKKINLVFVLNTTLKIPDLNDHIIYL